MTAISTLAENDLEVLLAELEEAWKEQLHKYAQHANVAGIDIGWKYTGGRQQDELAVRLLVREKVEDAVLRGGSQKYFCGDPFGSFGATFPAIAQRGLSDILVVDSRKRCRGERVGRNGRIENPTGRGLLPSPRKRRAACLQPGDSVSGADSRPSTIGAIAWDADGRRGILGSWHGLAGPLAYGGKPVMHPAVGDAPDDAAQNWIASLPRANDKCRRIGPGGVEPPNPVVDSQALVARIRKIVPEVDCTLFDAAFAYLDEEIVSMECVGVRTSPLGVNVQVTSSLQLNPKDVARRRPVFKSGRSTGVTTGYVEGIGVYFQTYSNQMKRVPILGFRIGVAPTQVQPGIGAPLISEPGDSGAMWVAWEQIGAQPGKHVAVGIHVDGDEGRDEEFGIACHIDPALSALGLKLEDPNDLAALKLQTGQLKALNEARIHTQRDLLERCGSPMGRAHFSRCTKISEGQLKEWVTQVKGDTQQTTADAKEA